MRLRRTSLLLWAFALTASSLAGPALPAAAQSVDDAQEQAEQAARQADQAAGLVDSAVADRDAIEADLAATIVRIDDLADQLSRVSAGVDRLHEQVSFADAELSGLENDIEAQAIDAYMTAVSAPGTAFVSSANVEDAMVAGLFVDDVMSAGQAKVDELVVKREALADLVTELEARQVEVSALKEEVDAEVDHLTDLYEQAEAGVAEAIREARSAADEYAQALGAVESAQARQAEQHRQEARDGPKAPSPDPGPDPEDDPSPATTTTTKPEPTTTEGGGGDDDGGGGSHDWDFPPAVERWRDEAAAFFPAARVDEALAILGCESLGDPDAYNPYSGASGLFQFLPSTWAATSPKAGFAGSSPFDPVANIGTAAWLAARYHDMGKSYWAPWSCRRVLA